MENRARILEAAARVYGEAGFRGATTRRIAQEAGVNEVTLFRIFGSKEALLMEALSSGAPVIAALPPLPETPADPEQELTEWAAAYVEHLRSARALIRKTMGELEERPEFIPCASAGPTCAALELRNYIARLEEAGLCCGDFQPHAAASMFMGALFADAMGRDIMPDVFPRPTEAAPRMYARLFLRAIGAEHPADGAARPTPAAPGAPTSAPHS